MMEVPSETPEEFLERQLGIRGTAAVEKAAAFEASTLKLVLGQLGAPKYKVNGWEKELKEGFGFDWFNSQGWLPHEVVATRVFQFNFLELFASPHRHPVTHRWKCLLEEAQGEHLLMVFKCYKFGRLIALNLPSLTETTALRVAVPGDAAFSVVQFSKFFSSYYGSVLEGDIHER